MKDDPDLRKIHTKEAVDHWNPDPDVRRATPGGRMTLVEKWSEKDVVGFLIQIVAFRLRSGGSLLRSSLSRGRSEEPQEGRLHAFHKMSCA